MLKNYFNPKFRLLLPQLKTTKTIRLFLIVLSVFLIGNNTIAQTTTQIFPSSITWTCPAGVTSITVEAWGGGARGLSTIGGGGGGAFAGNNAITVSPGVNYTITVGTGGIGGTTGLAGGNSSIALTSTPTVFLVLAEGGGNTGSTIGGRASASIGASGLVWSGGNGIVGTYYGGGGGGGSAGAGGAGGNGSDSINENGGAGGIGGIAGTGTAGAAGGVGGSKTLRDGFPGNIPGGGGGEKYYNNGNNAASGVGGNGQVIISYVKPTINTAATAASVCFSGSIQTTPLTFSATPGPPITYSITWNGSPGNAFLPVTDVALPASPITMSVPANTNAGTYTGILTVKSANGNFSAGNTFTITVNPLPPTTTGVTICAGGSGSLTATATCGPVSQLPQLATGSGGTSDELTYTNTIIPVSFPTLPVGAIVTNTSTTISYTANGISYRSELRARITPPASLGALQQDLQASTSASPGTVTNAPIGTWTTGNPAGNWLFEFRETLNDSGVTPDANITNVTITVNYTLPATLDWYTAASGGTKIGSGSPFNPVGVAGSGLTDTNTPGTYKFYAACSGNSTCRTATDFVINAAPLAPIKGTMTQPNCITATGSVVLSGLPTGNWTINPGTIAGNTVTATVSGLVAGTYNFTVTNASGCISPASANVVIIAPTTNTWNGAVWSKGLSPNNATEKIVFSGDYPPIVDPNIDLVGCSCEVTAGKKVIIKSGRTLTISNEVAVLGTGLGSGTLTFENNASLVQINDAAVNTGTITYLRQSTLARSTDYTYWSSPVANQQLTNISIKYLSGLFYSFTSGNWSWETPSNVMVKGKGYIIRAPQNNNPPSFYDGIFTGVPNNGTVTITTGAAGTFNLIGNPYPSAIDAGKFLTDNSGVLMGTIYLWTHNTAIQLAANILNNTAGSGAYAYTSDDYASYNGVGGIATSGGAIPSGKIAAGQSFFATSKAPGNAIINNSMRVTGGAAGINNAQFFKTVSNSKAADIVEKHRLWLNLTNNQGAFKQTLVGYLTGATNGFDDRFDGESFDSNTFVDFYSINQNKKLVIQGRTLPFETTDSVPLGYKSTIIGTFTISIGQADGLLAGLSVFIEDKLTNTKFDLKSGNYTFTTEKGVFNDRFILSYANKTLGTNDFNVLENQVLVSNKNKQIQINSFLETIDEVLVYDITGRQLYQKTKVNSNELMVTNLALSHQVLIVKVVLQNGQTLSRKVIY